MRWLARLLPTLLLACQGGPGPATACPDGQIPDGTTCVPEACGTGTWGNLETADDTVYVDVTANAGGDGSKDAPFASIQDGLDAQGRDGMVAVAAGTYVENLELTKDHSGIHLAGRCRDLVVVDGSGGSADEEPWGAMGSRGVSRRQREHALGAFLAHTDACSGIWVPTEQRAVNDSAPQRSCKRRRRREYRRGHLNFL